MRAGLLRHRLSILRRQPGVRDALGQPTTDFLEVGRAWAEVQPLAGREALLARQINAQITHRVRVRGRIEIRAADQLRLGARALEVISVADQDERRREQVLTCGEVMT